MSADTQEQEDELLALHSIFGSEEFVRDESRAAGEIRVSAELPANFTVALKEGETLRQYEMSFLPPLLLTFELPEDYPSSSPPSFSLTCTWLTHAQLSLLGDQLTDLYQATGGAVVLFTWAQFLKEDALRFLHIHTLLELPSVEHSTQDPLHDLSSAAVAQADQSGQEDFLHEGSVSCPLDQSVQGAASLPIHPREPSPNGDQTLSGLSLTPSQALLSQLLIYDADQQQKQFATMVFDCGVCFMSCLGSDCVQLSDCGHIFCQVCLGQFCKLQITEGNVRGVTCPQADCTATPTPAQVKSLVEEELFSRYDRLLLQNTLDCMADVVYCPRLSCGSAVIQEKSSNAAMCSVCGFAFCVACRKTYHGPDCQANGNMKKHTEDDAEQTKADLPQSQAGLKALWDDYATGNKQRRHVLESKYGHNVLQFTMEEYLSEDWIVFNCKHCPHCYTRIQKNKGCNMMTCSRCGQLFCWACLARLSPLDACEHFQDSPCSLSRYRGI
ncbi:E3 ubiquitin-protein ligase RNF14-like [Chelmon rostratus]|uniref:E3 ubiquitin-protein ligase RNF14-like n=1 Tax=Chelmon rostratus TaxID=109905 RepID=UPI001BE89206|nr:E3 ubiquitin-protein ligase RNF14-like [Chelmon rostratus]